MAAVITETRSIVCQRVDEQTPELTVVNANEIIYAFLESEIKDHIEAPWTKRVCFLSGVVYVRTGKGVYRTRFSHLTQLEQLVEDLPFMHVHRSLIARVDAIRAVIARNSKVGIGMQNNREWLVASERNFPKLLARLDAKPGASARRPRHKE